MCIRDRSNTPHTHALYFYTHGVRVNLNLIIFLLETIRMSQKTENLYYILYDKKIHTYVVLVSVIKKNYLNNL